LRRKQVIKNVNATNDNPSALCQKNFDKLRIKFEKGNTSNENSFN
jgi:hypothetical protein